MKVKITISFLLLLLGLKIQAQDSSTVCCRYQYNNYYDIAFSLGKQQIVGAISWSHLHGIGKKKRFKIGYGIRYSWFYGYSAGKFYTTAPSRYTSPVQGPTTIFSETFTENIDSIAFANPQVNAVNISIHLQYTILKKVDLGFNIDAIGFSFGKTQTASIISSVYDPGQPYAVEATPTKFNLLLTSDNDIGSLNSEFYLRYWITKNIGIRAGYTFLFTEYTTPTPMSFDNGRIQNDRYRLKSSLIMLAVSYTPFTKK